MKLRTLLCCGLLAFSILASNAASIAINFGADESLVGGGPSRSDVDGPAGILGTANWNNLDLLSGSAFNLTDSGGAATTANVTWLSNNTWASTGRSEENNIAAPGEDRDLMTGYLDTAGVGGQGVQIEVLGLGANSVYDVHIYIQGGVPDRGGDYMIGAETQSLTGVGPFDGTYITSPSGNHMVFSGVTGDGFILNTIPLTGGTARAPVNAIEINIIPEPGTAMLTMVGLLALGFVRRRRA